MEACGSMKDFVKGGGGQGEPLNFTRVWNLDWIFLIFDCLKNNKMEEKKRKSLPKKIWNRQLLNES